MFEKLKLKSISVGYHQDKTLHGLGRASEIQFYFDEKGAAATFLDKLSMDSLESYQLERHQKKLQEKEATSSATSSTDETTATATDSTSETTSAVSSSKPPKYRFTPNEQFEQLILTHFKARMNEEKTMLSLICIPSTGFVGEPVEFLLKLLPQYFEVPPVFTVDYLDPTNEFRYATVDLDMCNPEHMGKHLLQLVEHLRFQQVTAIFKAKFNATLFLHTPTRAENGVIIGLRSKEQLKQFRKEFYSWAQENDVDLTCHLEQTPRSENACILKMNEKFSLAYLLTKIVNSNFEVNSPSLNI